MTTKAEREARIEGLQADLTTKVLDLRHGEAWSRWLEFTARLHSYSFYNSMLIMLQCPEATHVASYKTWQSLGRQVRKGEQGLLIYAPLMGKREDKETGEEKSVLRGFKMVSTFDVSQTEGDDLPEDPRAATLLEGEAPAGLWETLATMVAEEGYTLERGDCGGANGVTLPDSKVVRVRADVSDAQAVKTLAHELAHILCGHVKSEEFRYDLHRDVAEVEAESVAHLVAGMHGMPTDTYTLPYVAGWGGKDVETKIKTSAQTVLRVAKAITARTLAKTEEAVAA